MDHRVKFGRCVRKYRKKLGMSQESLADLIGLHRTYISSVERGDRNVSLDNIVKLARGLRCSPPDLLK